MIRHQKNHCFKEENNKKSAKAQIAAAQIAQNLSSEDSNSSMDINSSVGSVGAIAAVAQQQSEQQNTGGTLLGGGGGVGVGNSQSICLNSPNNDNSNATSPNLNLYKTTCLSPQSSASQQQSFLQQSGSTTPTTNKYDCDKCNLTFSRHDQYKEHQLMHLINPNLLFNQQLLGQGFGGGDSSPYNLLKNMTAGNMLDGNSVDLTMQKKRKLSESSDNELNDFKTLNKKYKSDQFNFLYNYFLQNEPNEELKKQSKDSMDFDSLFQYYQMNELKKKGGNFDFLYQYYLQNEKHLKQSASPTLLNSKSPDLDAFGGEKPSFDFLLQYYQINESKKFLQTDVGAAQQEVKPDLNQTTEIMKQMLNLLQTQQRTAAAHQANPHFKQQQQPQTPSQQRPASASLASSTASMDSLNDQNQDIFNAGAPGITGSRSPERSVSATLSTAEKQNNKRLRTTILPEQLNFLYECYQNESNPSRKMLEEISKKVNLKKRVVQVNTIWLSFSLITFFSLFVLC